MFKVKAELFNGATAADGYSDMSAVDIRVALSMGRMRAIFLNKFVMRLLVSYPVGKSCALKVEGQCTQLLMNVHVYQSFPFHFRLQNIITNHEE